MYGCKARTIRRAKWRLATFCGVIFSLLPLHSILAQTNSEFGTNDFRISTMSTDGNPNFDAANSAIAYNSENDEYFVVWEADDDTGVLVDDQFQIYGQRVNALTGALVGSRVRISPTDNDGNADLDATDPSVAYNPNSNQFFVVWIASELGNLDNVEVYGQIVNGNGTLDEDEFVISNMGDFDSMPAAKEPAVIYNPLENHFFVVWTGAKDFEDEFEIYGRRIEADGTPIDLDDLRISKLDPDMSDEYGARKPAVAFSNKDNRYLVAWAGDTTFNFQLDDEFEIFVQLIDASDGTEVGGVDLDDLRISDMGDIGNTAFVADAPSVAYDSITDQFLVVWQGTDDAGTDTSQEIYGQFLRGDDLTEVGINDQVLSDMGPANDTSYEAFNPVVVYNETEDEFLVTWSADDDSHEDDAFEIYGQRVDAGTVRAPVGNNDFVLSDADTFILASGEAEIDAFLPAVAYNSETNTYLITWQADDAGAGLENDEFEIFGQLLALRGADLSISGSVSPNPVVARDEVSFTLTVSNIGVTASDPDENESGKVVVSTSNESGLVLSSYSGTGWQCFTTGSVVSCEIDSIAKGESSMVVLVFDTAAVTSSPITNVFDVAADEAFDPVSSNNAISIDTTLTVACSGKRPKVRKRGSSAIVILPKRLVNGLVSSIQVTATRTAPTRLQRAKRKPPRRKIRFNRLTAGTWRFAYQATLFDDSTCTSKSRKVVF